MSANVLSYSWDLTESESSMPKSLDFSIYLGSKICFLNLSYEEDGTLEKVLAEELDIRQLKCLYNVLKSIFESYEIGTLKLKAKEKKDE
tara:strand:+ start:1124 stop:1390 length:267 start_codon:yes stop_codon:yes gene_type:complete